MDPMVKQDCKFRREILRIAESSKAGGQPWLRGKFITDVLGMDDADHVLGLLTDLANLGMVELKDTRTMKVQAPGLIFTDFKITAKGTRLLSGLEPVEPLIEDERIG